MIGLLESPRLAQWLESHGFGRNPVVRFEANHRLPGLWWHATRFTTPTEETLARLLDYVEHGGKLFLSRAAALLVEPLLGEPPPDVIRHEPPPFFFRPGLYIEDRDHPLFERLARRHVAFGHGESHPFLDMAWSKRLPSRGSLLGRGLLNGAVLRDEAVCWEWKVGRGRVIAFTAAALDLQDHDGVKALASSVVRHLQRPCLLDFERPKSMLPPESYERARLGRHGLAFDRDKHAVLRVSLDPFQMEDPQVRLTLMRNGRVFRSTLATCLQIEAGELEEGYYELEARIDENCKETVPVLFRETGRQPVRHRGEITTLAAHRGVLEIDNDSGCAKGLHTEALNFVANETNSLLAGREPPPWFGSVMGMARVKGKEAWKPFSNRASRPLVERVKPEGIRFSVQAPGLPLSIAWNYELQDRCMQWTFTCRNEGDRALQIGSLHFPASFNTCFGFDAEQERTYAQRVMMHNLICRRGSYLFAEALEGKPPFLLVVPRFNEGFESMWHDQGTLGGRQPAWEGLLHIGIHTLAEEMAPWFNGTTDLILAPGEAKSYPFDLHLIDSYEEINDWIDPVLEPHPGMVVPVGMPTCIKIRSRLPYRVHGLPSTEGFKEPGSHTVRVITDAGESLYHFRAIPPIEDLIKARAAFIARHQQHHDAESERDQALLMWDAEEKALVIEPEHAYLAGGSDEACLADPVFLSAKQIFFPVKKEIEVLERYVERFLFAKVQDRKTFAVRRWVGEDPQAVEGHDIGGWTDRSFNYPHVFNIYYSLYVTGKRYGGTNVRPETYLERAARTALAYFEYGKCLNAAIEQGNIGDCALPLILDALEAEGMTGLRRDLDRAMEPKIRHMTEHERPFASEYTFDTTGYEGVYWIRSMKGDGSSVLSTIMGTRGKQPFWYHYGGDVRWGWGNSKLTSPDEICFNYMCGLNARVLLHAWLNVSPDPWWLKLGFAGSVAPWALVDADGTAHDFCGWEPGRVAFDAWSSEMGLGLAATLFSLTSVVTVDPLLGYGCRVKREHDLLHIEPCDGVRRRIAIRTPSGDGLLLRSERAPIRGAQCHLGELWIAVDLEGEAELKVNTLGSRPLQRCTSDHKVDLKPFLPHGFR